MSSSPCRPYVYQRWDVVDGFVWAYHCPQCKFDSTDTSSETTARAAMRGHVR